MALPISPMMSGDPTRGTSVSLSLHSSVNEVQFQNGRSLKKTNTQVEWGKGGGLWAARGTSLWALDHCFKN